MSKVPIPRGYASGGYVSDRGPTDDRVPVIVSPAEVWLTRLEYDRIGGRKVIEAINGTPTIVHIVDEEEWSDE